MEQARVLAEAAAKREIKQAKKGAARDVAKDQEEPTEEEKEKPGFHLSTWLKGPNGLLSVINSKHRKFEESKEEDMKLAAGLSLELTMKKREAIARELEIRAKYDAL